MDGNRHGAHTVYDVAIIVNRGIIEMKEKTQRNRKKRSSDVNTITIINYQLVALLFLLALLLPVLLLQLLTLVPCVFCYTLCSLMCCSLQLVWLLLRPLVRLYRWLTDWLADGGQPYNGRTQPYSEPNHCMAINTGTENLLALALTSTAQLTQFTSLTKWIIILYIFIYLF